jgi:hypothetical protein
VVRYSVSKEVEAISGRDVRLEMEVCSDPVPSKTTWEWGALQVEAGKVPKPLFLFLKSFQAPRVDFISLFTLQFKLQMAILQHPMLVIVVCLAGVSELALLMRSCILQ